MKLTIEIALDNAALVDGGTNELELLLMELCERLPEPFTETREALSIHDSNGNYVGEARIS